MGIRSTGEKKCSPMNWACFVKAFARPVIGSVEVLLAKIASRGYHRFGLARHVGFYLRVLEYGLDDQIALREVRVSLGRLDASQRLVCR